MFPTLIQFVHGGKEYLSVRDKNVSFISVTPEEQGRALAFALGCPLFLRREASFECAALVAAHKVQEEWSERFAMNRWDEEAVGCPEGFNIIA